MDWVAVLGAIGIPTILGTLIPFMVTRYYNRKDKKEDKEDNTKEKLIEIQNNYENLSVLHRKDAELLKNSLDEMNQVLVILKNAQQAILRDRIIQMYNIYKEKGYMPIYARESLEHMFNEYKKLGGNGVIKTLVERLYQLPTELIENTENDLDV